MPTITTVDATWTNGTAMDEAELRRADSAMFLGDGSNNGVRGGIVRHGDNSLAVSVNGSDQVTVQAGAAVIPAATGLGVYRAALSAATAATGLSSRNATNPRIDLVVMQIVSGQAVVQTVDGTPGASPSAPALPANAVELARLNVPAVAGGAVTVTTSFRQYAAALGGTLVVETAARLPGSGNQKWQRAIALDNGYTYLWSGSTWRLEGTLQSYTPTWTSSGTAPTLGNGTLTGSYMWRAGMIEYRINLTFGTTSTAGSGFYRFGLPVAANGDLNGPAGTASLYNPGISTLPGLALLYDASGLSVYVVDNLGNSVSGTTPYSVGPGDSILIVGSYVPAAA